MTEELLRQLVRFGRLPVTDKDHSAWIKRSILHFLDTFATEATLESKWFHESPNAAAQRPRADVCTLALYPLRSAATAC
jgi:hypothetical protein